MKVQSYILLPVLFALILPAESVNWQRAGNAGQSRVKRVMGVSAFIQSRPVRLYDTVCVYTTRKGPENYPGTSTPNQVRGITAAIDDLLSKAIAHNRKFDRRKRHNRKNKLERIDAIITDNGFNAVAVSWKTRSHENDYDQGCVKSVNGLDMYIRSEVLVAHEKIFGVRLPVRLTLQFTGYKTHEDMLHQLTECTWRKADSLSVRINGLVTDDGINAWAIVYK